MTDANQNLIPAPAISADFSAYLAKDAARNRLAAELHPVNKTKMFDALSAAGIISVVVVFDGYGDSGQIESIDANDAHGEVALPEGEIELASPSRDGDKIERESYPLKDAIEELAYDLLRDTHAGWENNDGAYGEFVFDVAARTISLDHNSRYTAVESYSHEW